MGADREIPGSSAGSSARDPGTSGIFADVKMFDTALNFLLYSEG